MNKALFSTLVSSSYLQLPSPFYQSIAPTPVASPRLIFFNQPLALALGVADLIPSDPTAVAMLAGNVIPSSLQTVALAYAGHQFGYYVPLLGDGRAIILGEIRGHAGKRWEVQLKGSGKTRFSRQGDGRAPLSAVLREYLISEAMYGLGIPTTRCLAVIASTDNALRQEGSVPIGILTRIAASHIRIGSFQFAAAQQDSHLLAALFRYAVERHYPHLARHDDPYLEFFRAVVDQQARLIAEWMGVGFIHGVMNTDNMSISGETIDYGPCAFIDAFDFNTVFSSIDRTGRYAFGNQAAIAQWNLEKLGSALLLLGKKQSMHEQLQEILASFTIRFNDYWTQKIKLKLGMHDPLRECEMLISRFFGLLQRYQPDFTTTFRLLAEAIDSPEAQKRVFMMLGGQNESEQWLADWLTHLRQQNRSIEQVKQAMHAVNPLYIPRNHLIEQAINQFIEHQDDTLINSLLSVFRSPYILRDNTAHLQRLPLPEEKVWQTFCGT